MNEIKNELTDYAELYTSPEGGLLAELRKHCTENYEDSSMLAGFYQGRLLAMISRMIRPNVVLEIGTYLGYSTLCLAEGLAPAGRVISVDVNAETNAVAQSFIDRSEYFEQIQLMLGEATFILPHLEERYDLVFLDADKPNYSNYYDLVIEDLRPGGYVVADNVLWSGKVLEENKDEDAQALHDFNQKVQADDRVTNILLPVRDGLMVACKLA